MLSDPLADFDREILQFLQAAGLDPASVQLVTPSRREFGERATNVSRLAKEQRQPPPQIAEDIARRFDRSRYRLIAAVEPAGGFVNFRMNYQAFVPQVVEAVACAGALFGRRPGGTSQRVIVEHTSVNPNKEWHIGHVRNAVLGDVVTRLLRLAGHDVQVQNYIDDTGPQAAQAVVGLRDFPEEPRSGEKFDHYSGRLYVKINAELASERGLRARLEELRDGAGERGGTSTGFDEITVIEARLANIDRLKARIVDAMRALERGEFHGWMGEILDAQLQTAYRLGIYYNLLNWESHIVRSHTFEDALQRLAESPRVYEPETGRYAGALVIESGPPSSEAEEPRCEVLIRSNGIPTYVAKDIAYHMWKLHLLPDRLRYGEYATQPNDEVLWTTGLEGEQRTQEVPDRAINMIAVDQTQAQEAVKEGLRAAGFPDAAAALYHLGYGLVTTEAGRISGRKGTSVAGDTVIDEAVRVAYERVKEKRSQDLTDEDMQRIAEAVGIGAVRYFMAQYNPLRNIVFNVADVVSYDGNTGLYVQYALVRAFAILRKAAELGIADEAIEAADASLLQHEQERRLMYHIAQYPGVVADASRTLAVNLVAEFAFDLATIFSQFYRDCGVLNAEPGMREARLLLVRTVRDALANACSVLGVPAIERL